MSSEQRARPQAAKPMWRMLGVSLAVHVLLVLASRRAEHVVVTLPARVEPQVIDVWAGDTTEPPGAGDAKLGATPTSAPPAHVPSRANPQPSNAAAPSATKLLEKAPSAATLPRIPRAEPPARPRPAEPRRRAVAPAAPTPPETPRDEGAGTRGPTADGAGVAVGAEGAASIRDLGRAFTRALPAACVADVGWAELPVGDAGSITVRIRVDEAGRVADWEPLDTSSPAQLVRALRRTIAMLGTGAFRARGTQGAGVDAFRLRARVSDEPQPTGAIALEQTWTGAHGEAAFTQASGRRVVVVIDRVKPD